MKRNLIRILLYRHVFSKIPYGYGKRVRFRIMKPIFKKIGEKSTISTGVDLIGPQKISIGENVGIARDSVLDGRGGLKIGDNTMIGFETVIITMTHKYSRTDIPIKEQGMYSKPVEIGSNCWIGTRAIILPGVKIGKERIIGANSLVTEDIPDGKIAGGIPAKIIKDR